MKLSLRRALALIAAFALSVTGLTSLSVSAHATTTTNIRLITPVITATNSVDHQGDMNGWIGNGWYGAGSTFKKMYAPVGATINLTYQATDGNGNPLTGQTMTLHLNKGWSGSNAALSSGATTIGASNQGTDGGTLTAVTDGYGQATFVLTNTDTTSGETNPTSLTTEPAGTPLYSQIYPEITGQASDSADMVEFHFVNTMPNAVGAQTDAYLSHVGPVLNDTNSVSQQGQADYFVGQGWYASGLKFRQSYVKVGSSFNASWQYTDVNGNPVAGQQVQLVVNKAWSGSTASLSSGATTIAPTNAGNDSAVLTATTDAFGVAVFPLTNTDATSTEANPATPTTAPSGTSQLYSQTFAQVAGATNHSALIEYHFVATVPAIVPPSTPSPTPSGSSSGPAVANIRLLDSEKDTTKDAYLTPGWYDPDGTNSPAFVKYGTVGETTTLTYVATDANGAPIANTAIWLMVNSGSEHATETNSDGSALAAAPTQASWWKGYTGATFGGAIQGTTDANGQVTFTVKNTNVNADGESIRDVKNAWSDSTNGKTLAAGFYPTMQATTEHIDRLWYHLQTSVPVADTSVTIRLIDSQKDLATDTTDVTNWWAPDGVYSPAYLKYFTVGGNVSLTYVAKDHAGNPIANTPIWLNINEAGNNAAFTKADGSALDAPKTGWKFVGYDSAAFAGSVSGTTDANGQVTFTLKNTDSNSAAENIRSVKNSWTQPTGSELKGAFYPTLAGSNLEHIDRVWGHMVKQGPATLTAGSATKAGKVGTGASLTFTLKNALGAAVPNATVQFVTNAGGTLGAASGVTDSSGNVTVTASATAAGSQLVTASYIDSDNQAAVATSTVTWSAAPVVVVTKASVTVKKRVIVVTVTNGKGKSQVVSVTGLSKSVKTLKSNAATSTSFTVKKAGRYTVKVTVGGQVLYSKVVTVN